jgi:hypothetical protein
MTPDDRLQSVAQLEGSALLDEARRLGIEMRYVDAGGHEREIDLETVRRVVEALSNTQPDVVSLSRRAPRPKAAFAGQFERAWGNSGPTLWREIDAQLGARRFHGFRSIA